MSRRLAIILRSIVLQEDNVTIAAEKLHIGRPGLSNVLNGKTSLSIELACKIEDVYRYSGLALLQKQLEYDFEAYRFDISSLILPVKQKEQL